MTKLTNQDIEQIRARGASVDDIEAQLVLFADPPAPAAIVRPATVGDGILRLKASEHGRYLSLHADAAARGRLSKMVPASGAATRMFKGLQAALSAGEITEDAESFAAELDRFPFSRAVREAADGPDVLELVEALLAPERLGYADLPKGLIPFHQAGGELRTPFEEHLFEAAETVRDDERRCAVHLTVSPEHEAGFRSLLEDLDGRLAPRLGVRFDVGFSHQEPATDTVAVDLENRPLRDDRGRLVFRPGGHGALIGNLQALGGDIVLIKNIDNVQPASRAATTFLWKRLLAGVLLELQSEIHAVAGPLAAGDRDEPTLAEARRICGRRLGLVVPAAASGDWLLDRLDRPIRVCGMVRNEGEPGGGPYWVRGREGDVTPQIVESSQIDLSDPRSAEIVAQATHFNPVDLACAVRDHRGEPFELARFVDASSAFIARKSKDGREIKALERPGLWNGAMAGWNTLFLEVPLATFSPVKTVFDLLRPEHQ